MSDGISDGNPYAEIRRWLEGATDTPKVVRDQPTEAEVRATVREWHPKCETCGYVYSGETLHSDPQPMWTCRNIDGKTFAEEVDPKSFYCSDHTELEDTNG